MPRFHFDLHDGTSIIDDEGTVLPDLAEARIQAAKMAGALLSDEAVKFWEGAEWTINVRDEGGLVLFSLVFMAVDGPGTPARRHAQPA
jgi:hypothetical protein